MQAGAKVDVIGSREYTVYSCQAPRNTIDQVLGQFAAMVDTPAFKSWELDANVKGRMAKDNANLPAGMAASELLHKAAFRDQGLGNSLYSPDFMVGQHSSAMLKDFHSKNYLANRVVVVGVDVDHDLAMQCGEKLNLEKGPASLQVKIE